MELLKISAYLMAGIGLGYGCSGQSRGVITASWLLVAAGLFILHFLGVRW